HVFCNYYYLNLILTILGSRPCLVMITLASESLFHCTYTVSGIVVFIILLASYLSLMDGSGKSSFLRTSIVFILLGEWLTFNCVSSECENNNQFQFAIYLFAYCKYSHFPYTSYLYVIHFSLSSYKILYSIIWPVC